LLVNVLKLPPAFSSLANVCVLILTLYVSAFFGIIYEVSVLLAVLSTIYGLYDVITNYPRGKNLLLRIKLPHIWLFAYCLIVGNILFQTQLEHYDNFSHWALIVKYLFTEGHLPLVEDTIISYPSYPMG